MLCVLAIMTCAAAPLSAADSPIKKLVNFFFGGAPEPAPLEMAIPDLLPLADDAGAQFRPQINRMAARELYYVEKICQPDAAQMEHLKGAVSKAAAELALDYAKSERAGRAAFQWTAPRPYFAEAIASAADEVLPAEAVARYREEVEAREQAFQDAGQRMIVRGIDRRVTLRPDQYEPLREAVAGAWDSGQYHGTTYFQYEEYLQFPSNESLSPILDDRQTKALRQGTNYGRIHFGWDQEFGFTGWNDNGIELDGLEDLTEPVDQPDLPQEPDGDENVPPGKAEESPTGEDPA